MPVEQLDGLRSAAATHVAAAVLRLPAAGNSPICPLIETTGVESHPGGLRRLYGPFGRLGIPGDQPQRVDRRCQEDHAGIFRRGIEDGIGSFPGHVGARRRLRVETGCDQALGHCYRPEQDSANAGRFAGRTSTFPVRGPIGDARPGAVRAAVRGTRQAATAIVAGTGTPCRLRRRDHWRRPDSRWSVCNNYRQGVSRGKAVSGRFRGAIRQLRRSGPEGIA